MEKCIFEQDANGEIAAFYYADDVHLKAEVLPDQKDVTGFQEGSVICRPKEPGGCPETNGQSLLSKAGVGC